jgi:hypothetical protein
VRDVFVQRVGGAELGLQPLEMRGVVLVADAQQSGVEQAVLVDAFGVVVGAPQDPHPAVVLEGGQGDVRGGSMTGVPLSSTAAKSGVSNSPAPVSGAPDSLCLPNTRFWSPTRSVSQFSIRIWILRTTW